MRATCAYAKQIFETAYAMQDAVRSHPELRIIGQSDVLLLVHVRRVRHLPRQRLHAADGLAVQRAAVPERDPHGRDPPADRSPAWPTRSPTISPRPSPTPHEHKPTRRRSQRAIYGGVAGGLTDDADEFIRAVMADMMDAQQALP